MRRTQTSLRRSTTPKSNKESRMTKLEGRLRKRHGKLTEAVEIEETEVIRAAAGKNAAIMMK